MAAMIRAQTIYNEDSGERVMDNNARLIERGPSEGHILKCQKDEYRYIRPDGTVVWIESDLSLSIV